MDIQRISPEFRKAARRTPTPPFHKRWMLKLVRLVLRLGVDPERIAVAGQSAGGGLTAHLCQRILDHGGVQPVAQLLWCPMLDDRTAANISLDALKHVSWSNKSNRAGWSGYLGCDAGSDEVPVDAVPSRRENLSGLPPAWIGIGDIDLFYEENKAYAERLKDSGVDSLLPYSAGRGPRVPLLINSPIRSMAICASGRKL